MKNTVQLQEFQFHCKLKNNYLDVDELILVDILSTSGIQSWRLSFPDIKGTSKYLIGSFPLNSNLEKKLDFQIIWYSCENT